MRNIIIVVFILISLRTVYCTDEGTSISSSFNTDIYAKRKILILPFLNKNKITDYDYLSSVIMESIRSELTGTDKYDFNNFSSVENKLMFESQKTDFTNIKNAKYIAVQLNSDVVITGQYVIIEKKIMIFIHIIDILSGELVGITKVEGNTGVDIFNVVNEAVKDISEKIDQKLQPMEQKRYNELMNKNLKLLMTPAKRTGIGLIIAGGASVVFGAVWLPTPIWGVPKTT